MPKVTVKQEPDANVPIELLAQSIVDLAQGIRKLRSGHLNDRALLLLVSHASGIGQRDVSAVLRGIEELERLYIKKPK